MKYRWDFGHFSLDLQNLSGKSAALQSGTDAAITGAADRLTEKFEKGTVGFHDWPARMPAGELFRMEELSARLKREFDSAVVFGIGGSYLGGATIQDALQSEEAQEAFPVTWLSNTDGDAVARTHRFLKKRRSMAVVISKSGGTTETLAGFFHFSREMDSRGFVVITDPMSGELRRQATHHKWHSLNVPPNIGGRFSVLTAVGLFPALLMGVSASEILEGATEMRRELDAFSPAENPAYLYAYLKFHWDTHGKHGLQYLMPYRGNLARFAHWYVQLWGESLGKRRGGNGKGDHVGPTPVAALGTSDQHSLLQLFKEGPRDKIVGFMDVEDRGRQTVIGEPPFPASEYGFLFPRTFEEITSKASFATEKSLVNSGVPTYRFSLPDLTARALGALFFFHETACAFAGELYGVDAFNQPGVEEAKRLLREAL